MEHNHHDLHEAAHITDEALEGVAGGIYDLSISGRVICSYCKKQVFPAEASNFRNKIVCHKCKAKLESGDASAAAAAASL